MKVNNKFIPFDETVVLDLKSVLIYRKIYIKTYMCVYEFIMLQPNKILTLCNKLLAVRRFPLGGTHRGTPSLLTPETSWSWACSNPNQAPHRNLVKQ